MNALAYSDEDGLIDYSGGILDIRDKIIRVNDDNEEIFIADPLRILRAIRLSGEYGMKIDPKTQEYMFEHKELLRDVAPERIRDELCKIMVTTHCAFYLKKYFEIFLIILPELSLMEGFHQNNPHHIYNVLDHTFVTIKNIEPNLELRLAMLFHDIAKPFTYSKDENGVGTFTDHEIRGAEMTRDILNRLKFSKKIIQRVTKLVEYHNYEIPEKDIQVKAFLSKFGIENIEDLFKINKSFVLEGHICRTVTPKELDLHVAVCGKVGSFEEGYEFDAVVLDDSILAHPQRLNLAERMERAVYLGLDEKNITAKFVAGTKII
jgi:tRNA nucleotidyltransferase (CCA-adding enzyme)